MNGVLGRAAIVLGAIGLLSTAAATQAPDKLALTRVEPGLWQLRDLDSPSAAPRRICVADASSLVQIEHRGAPCARVVLSADARQATVHYTCPSSGFGRTSLRVETPRLVKVDTQGISGSVPFALRAEARRTGSCAQAR